MARFFCYQSLRIGHQCSSEGAKTMKCMSHLVRVVSGACLALFASVGAGQEKDAAPDNTPTFESPSSEAILLRYKFKAGQVMKMDMQTEMDMKIKLGGQELTMKQTMRIDAKSAVTEVDDEGNISIVAKVSRLRMKISGLMQLDFDTDKPSEDPNFQAVTAMINVGIPCKLSPVGKILETDMEPLRLAVRRAGNAALAKVLEDSTDKMFEGTFVHLSEQPVKAGDTYKSGTIVEDKIKIHMSYKIKAVSGDKSQAVLEPVAVLEAAPDAFPGVEAKIKSQKLAGWLLYDVEKGYPSKGEVRMNGPGRQHHGADGSGRTHGEDLGDDELGLTKEEKE
jgi:hypothetical protein